MADPENQDSYICSTLQTISILNVLLSLQTLTPYLEPVIIATGACHHNLLNLLPKLIYFSNINILHELNWPC